MHLPFANDAALKEHAERCLAFDHGILQLILFFFVTFLFEFYSRE
jgi:hypothetical protein